MRYSCVFFVRLSQFPVELRTFYCIVASQTLGGVTECLVYIFVYVYNRQKEDLDASEHRPINKSFEIRHENPVLIFYSAVIGVDRSGTGDKVSGHE